MAGRLKVNIFSKDLEESLVLLLLLRKKYVDFLLKWAKNLNSNWFKSTTFKF